MLPRFAAGQRVRALTGATGTVVDPARPGTAQGRPAGVRVQLDPWTTNFGVGRKRQIRCVAIYHADDLTPL